MPSKYILRKFMPGGYYHIFNRGNAKQTIFHNEKDYKYFLHIISEYLSPQKEKNTRKNFHEEIHLFAYCLMPNHFHLCLKQESERSVAGLLRCISQVYARYYNQKYDRVGHIFQDKYKARLLKTDSDLLHATRYIHSNPIDLKSDIESYPYSSFQFYLSRAELVWLEITPIMDIFSAAFNPKDPFDAYRSFVLTYAQFDFHKVGAKMG